MESNEGGRSFFPVTDWPLVEQAGQDQLAGSTLALGELLQRYQRPLTSWLIERCRCDQHRAEDLLQGFLADIVVRNQLISRATSSKGHQFRSFLVRALSNYVISQARRDQSQKRQPESGLESLDHLLEQGEVAVARAWTPSFDVTWAQSVVAEAVERMRIDCSSNGQAAIWGVFDCRLRAPILEGAPIVSYEELVQRFGFPSPIHAQNALTTAKRKFARTLREVVKQYTPDDTAAEVEVRELQLILSTSGWNSHP